MLRTVHDNDDWNAEARGETPMQRGAAIPGRPRDGGQATDRGDRAVLGGSLP